MAHRTRARGVGNTMEEYHDFSDSFILFVSFTDTSKISKGFIHTIRNKEIKSFLKVILGKNFSCSLSKVVWGSETLKNEFLHLM